MALEQARNPHDGSWYYVNRVSGVMVNYPTPKQFIPFVFDWCQVQDPTTGAYYFSSESTGASSWSKPFTFGWQQKLDTNTGAEYYVNESTGESSWTPPVPKLITDWRVKVDRASDRLYYYSESTQYTSWLQPAGFTPPDPESPDAWCESVDPSSQRPYYYNCVTRETRWMPPGCLLTAVMRIGFYLRDLEAPAGTGVHLQVLCDDQELGHTEQLLGARPATPVFKEEVKIPIVFEEPQDLVVKVVQSDTGAVIGECSTSVGKMLRVKGRAEIALRRPRLTSGDLGSAVGVVGVSAQVVINGPSVFHGDVDARQAAEVNPQTFEQWRATLPMAQRMHMVARRVPTVKLTFAARNLDFSSVSGGSDPKPLLVVSRIRDGSLDDAVVVAQSASIQDWKTVNPTWLPMLIPETKLCGANRDARLMLEIYHRRRESNCIVAAVETSLPELLQLSGGRTLSLARIGHVGSVPHRAASHAQKCGLLRVTAAEITTTTMHMREPKPRAVLERQYNGIMALRRRRAQLAVEQTFPPVVRLIRHFFGGCTLHLMVAVDFGVQRTGEACSVPTEAVTHIATACAEYSMPQTVRCIGLGGTSASLPPASREDSSLLFRVAPDALDFPVDRLAGAIHRTARQADSQVGNMTTNQVLAVLEHGQRYAAQFGTSARGRQHFVVILLVSPRDLPDDPAVGAMLSKLSTTPLTVVMLGLGHNQSGFRSSSGVAAELAKSPRSGAGGAGAQAAGGDDSGLAAQPGRRASTFARLTSRKRRDTSPLPMFRERATSSVGLSADDVDGGDSGEPTTRISAPTTDDPSRASRSVSAAAKPAPLLRRRSSFALVTEGTRSATVAAAPAGAPPGASGHAKLAGAQRNRALAQAVLRVIPLHFQEFVDANGLVPELYGRSAGGNPGAGAGGASAAGGGARPDAGRGAGAPPRSARPGASPAKLGAATRLAAQASGRRRGSPPATYDTSSRASSVGSLASSGGSPMARRSSRHLLSVGDEASDTHTAAGTRVWGPTDGTGQPDTSPGNGSATRGAGHGATGGASSEDADAGFEEVASGAARAGLTVAVPTSSSSPGAGTTSPLPSPSLSSPERALLHVVNSGFSGAKVPPAPSPSSDPSAGRGRALKPRRGHAPRAIAVVSAESAGSNGHGELAAGQSPSEAGRSAAPGPSLVPSTAWRGQPTLASGRGRRGSSPAAAARTRFGGSASRSSSPTVVSPAQLHNSPRVARLASAPQSPFLNNPGGAASAVAGSALVASVLLDNNHAHGAAGRDN